MFSTIEEEASHSSADTDTIPKGVSIATGTANLQRFNDNDRITSNNPDRIVVALRKLPVPWYLAKRPIPNPLICVQPSSLPLKQDMTKQSCANLVKRIRNPLAVQTAAATRDEVLMTHMMLRQTTTR
jgi:hypothetical protein